MRHFIQCLFTGEDNETWDLGRVAWGISLFAFIIVFLALELFSVAWRSVAFDPVAFATGFAGGLGGISALHCVALRLKGDTEPEAK